LLLFLKMVLFHKFKLFKSTFCASKKLEKNPQKKGFCLKVFTMNPKKPNSALRAVVKCLLSNKKYLFCHIKGIGHKLQKHSNILIYGYRVRDLPLVNYRAVRGKFDLKPVLFRVSSRSKYGCKKIVF